MGPPSHLTLTTSSAELRCSLETTRPVIKPMSSEKIKIMREAWGDCQDLLDPDTKQWKKMPEGMALSTWMPEKIDV